MKKVLIYFLLCSIYLYFANTGGTCLALTYNLTFIAWPGLVLIMLAWRYRSAE